MALDGEILFNLTFGIEVVIPLEIGLSLHKVEAFDALRDFEDLWANLDLLEEARKKAWVQMVTYHW